MAERYAAMPMVKGAKPLIAMTELGFCDVAVHHVRSELARRGYDMISFHATDMGDGAMEDLVKQGCFDGVIDLVPAGYSEHLLGGNRVATAERLDGACERDVPYILTPSAALI